MCGSLNSNQTQMNKLINAVRPRRIDRVAGSGNKFIHLVEENSDYYLNFVPGFKFWDMCASEALMMSRHGLVTNANKGPIIYNNKT